MVGLVDFILLPYQVVNAKFLKDHPRTRSNRRIALKYRNVARKVLGIEER